MKNLLYSLLISSMLASVSLLAGELSSFDQRRLDEINEELESMLQWQAKHRQTARHFSSKAYRVQFRSGREAGKFRRLANDAQDNATALQLHIDQLKSEKKALLHAARQAS